MDELAGRPYWVLTFDEDGGFKAPDTDTLLAEVTASQVRDLFVLSHGWNTTLEAADRLYGALGPLIKSAADAATGLGPIGFVGVHWPAVWFPDRPNQVPRGEGAGSAQFSTPGADRPRGTGDADLSGAEIAADLQAGFTDADRRADADLLGQLIDEGLAAVALGREPESRQQERLEEFHQVLRRVVDLVGPATAPEDCGETELLATSSPRESFGYLAEAFGDTPSGGSSQDIGDVFAKAWQGAKNALRATSYYVMKARAGKIGGTGLGPLLEQLHNSNPATRVHLVGHSFGARLVAFSLSGITSPEASPIHSLVLIQGAFSHFSFAHRQDNPFDSPGALRAFATRVHGPLISTHSRHDWALTRWYPKASALARQDNQARPEVSRWGALGGGGFQAVEPLESLTLLESNRSYQFARHGFYSIEASARISDEGQSRFAGAHSDIRHPEVAWLVACAAATGTGSQPS